MSVKVTGLQNLVRECPHGVEGEASHASRGQEEEGKICSSVESVRTHASSSRIPGKAFSSPLEDFPTAQASHPR